MYKGDLFRGVLELWVAARRDPELAAALAPAEASINGAATRLGIMLFPERLADPEFPLLMAYARAAIRGLALQQIITPSTGDGAELWPYMRSQLLRAFGEA